MRLLRLHQMQQKMTCHSNVLGEVNSLSNTIQMLREVNDKNPSQYLGELINLYVKEKRELSNKYLKEKEDGFRYAK